MESALPPKPMAIENGKQDDEEWTAAWSDDGGDGELIDGLPTEATVESILEKKRGREESKIMISQPKKRKVVAHHRSHLAALLVECFEKSPLSFQEVTDHISTLGPSAIDVSLSTLCNGMHDLEGGLPLLKIAALWLLEACQSRQRFEAVNAYLARFLYLHSNVIAGIDDSIKQKTESKDDEEDVQDFAGERSDLLAAIRKLKQAQESASGALREKTQHTLCLLRHFSRMI
jgi:U3 small nucleolar RNA-associated protein 21